MYADDMVLFAKTKKGLQEQLNHFANYCDQNKLNINTDKTKVMVFGKRTRKYKFYINKQELEQVNSFKYQRKNDHIMIMVSHSKRV